MSKYYFVGSGIASLAGAAYLIRDGNVNGDDIIIFEESKELGGALDAHGTPKSGYFMSGSRMFEHKYNATFDLLSFIPSISDPSISVKEETDRAKKDAQWHNKARLVNRKGEIINFHELGFSGSEAGKGGLITFKDSQWLLTLSIFNQPFYVDQPEDVFVWWGYGLYQDRPGDYIKKPMAECTGKEILEEVLGHLKFDDDKEKILASSICIPCMMPYITSQFLVRKHGDRPEVVPKGSTNLAFIGQFSELPDDVVFTVEYSVRSAQIAVYSLLKLDKKPSPFYKGQYDPRLLWDALKTLHR